MSGLEPGTTISVSPTATPPALTREERSSVASAGTTFRGARSKESDQKNVLTAETTL
jgi:hypothetical protein